MAAVIQWPSGWSTQKCSLAAWAGFKNVYHFPAAAHGGAECPEVVLGCRMGMWGEGRTDVITRQSVRDSRMLELSCILLKGKNNSFASYEFVPKFIWDLHNYSQRKNMSFLTLGWGCCLIYFAQELNDFYFFFSPVLIPTLESVNYA